MNEAINVEPLQIFSRTKGVFNYEPAYTVKTGFMEQIEGYQNQ